MKQSEINIVQYIKITFNRGLITFPSTQLKRVEKDLDKHKISYTVIIRK